MVIAAGESTYAPLAETSLEDFDRVFAVNARGMFVALQEAARRVRDGGRIVTISSGATSMPSPTAGVYAASKAAGELLTLVLAKELGPRGITVNSVSPGPTDTDGLVMPRQAVDQLVSMTALRRLGRPDDVAQVITFLASESAGWVTGQRVAAAGGLL